MDAAVDGERRSSVTARDGPNSPAPAILGDQPATQPRHTGQFHPTHASRLQPHLVLVLITQSFTALHVYAGLGVDPGVYVNYWEVEKAKGQNRNEERRDSGRTTK